MRRLSLLSEKQVRNLKPDADKFVKRVADGGGLYLQATVSTDGVNRNWIFRYELDKVRHDLGIGPLHTVSLAEARKRATALRLQILDGIDPAQERATIKAERLANRAEKLKATTFLQCWESYFKIHAKDWKHPKHAKQWQSTMRDYVLPTLGNLNVADIETAHVEKTLAPIWDTIPETASRVQNRIKLVMAYAIAGGLRGKDNPAARDLVKSRLGKLQRTNGHHAALQFEDAPAFMAELRKVDSVPARALEFTVLTAVRTGETIGALWNEIDITKRVWTIPAERMKADREHRVPLSDRAIEILNSMPHRDGLVFLNGRNPLSESIMARLLKRMRPGAADVTVHGFRSTFRDWAAERTNYPRELCELCLAHAVGDKVEAAYRRGDGLNKRVRLMQTWADYARSTPRPKTDETPKTGDVVNLKDRRRAS
jgi:integrase